MRRYFRAIKSGCAILAASTHAAIAQNAAQSYVKRPIPAVKAASPPTIDGDISEAAWKAAPSAEGFVDLQNGTLVAEQTTARILYDDKFIYVAFHCTDTEPGRIFARETIRDYRFGQSFDRLSEDAVEVAFDPFMGHKQADRSIFSLNSLGTRSASLAGGRGAKVEWKGDWDGAVKRVSDGWTAEMRIPWGILNYPASKQPINIGINFARSHARTRIDSIWSNITSQGFYDQDGDWIGALVPAGSFHSKLSLLPYVLTGIREGNAAFRSGLDARYTVKPELTAVSTINPDFGTIEGAIEGIQFSRSERFVPERRPFFLEGSDYFRVLSVDAIGPLFFSNHIQSFDLGTKVYGKLSPKDTLGFLHAIDFGTRSDIVTRYRRNLSPTSFAGFFVSQKSSLDENNSVGGVDQSARWGKLELDSEWIFSGGHDAQGDAKQANFVYFDKYFAWAAGYVDVSPRFHDANGLIFFNDFRGFISQASWFAEWRKGFWRNFTFQVTPQLFFHYDGRPYRRGWEGYFNMETRSDWNVALTSNYMRFDDQTDSTYGLAITKGISNRFSRIGVSAQTGLAADRPISFVGPLASFRIFRRMDVSYSGSIQNLDGVTQQHIGTFTYQFSPNRSFGGRVVTQNADTNWYVSFRNSGAKGLETYVIVGDPNARRFVHQGLVKLVFAL